MTIRITTLSEATAVLEAGWPARHSKHRMSLDYMRDIMDFLGNPQDTYKVIHVAGTSGKTSTSYYVAALLQAGGRRTGLTISPHVDSVNERVQIGLQPLPAADYVSEMNIFLEQIESSGLTPTYFEILYAFAFWEFARQRVEYAVVEVGVGGTLDNTNIITRTDKVSVLTDIGFDHMRVLGNTLPEIASQKAGIIPVGGSVFCWKQDVEVLQVFQEAAKQKHADLHVLDSSHLGAGYDFLPVFQRRNFELALQAVRFVLGRDGYGPLSKTGCLLAAHTVIPGRMEIRHYKGKSVVLDGSHNPQKLQALMESVKAAFPGQDIAVLTGFARSSTLENRVSAGAAKLMTTAAHLILTSFMVNRVTPHASADPQAVAAACDKAGYNNYEIVTDPHEAFQALLQRPEPVVVITGSFFLLNVIRPLLTGRAK